MSLILNDLAIGYPNHLVMAGIGGPSALVVRLR